MIKLTIKGDGISFPVRVQPRASRTGITGEREEALNIRLASPPVDGEANEELRRVLAKLFNIPRQHVEIISGQTSKNKVVRLSGVTAEDCQKVLSEVLR